jgi:hypothetical protein
MKGIANPQHKAGGGEGMMKWIANSHERMISTQKGKIMLKNNMLFLSLCCELTRLLSLNNNLLYK